MITFDQVSFHYPQRESVIKNLSISFKSGEYICIIGTNGSGKSTLARLMNGLLVPIEGNVTYNQYNTSNILDVRAIRQKVGMVFQNPQHQIIATTVSDDVAFGLQNMGVSTLEISMRVKEALKKVDMWTHHEAEVHRLSGGQQQRVAIAGILAMEPEVIIFDESTSMLDPQGRDEVYRIMKQLNEQGITIISITHEMEDITEAARVIVLERGEVIQDGTPQQIFDNTDWNHHHMSIPFIVEFRNRLKDRGISIPKSIMNLNQLVEHMIWKLS